MTIYVGSGLTAPSGLAQLAIDQNPGVFLFKDIQAVLKKAGFPSSPSSVFKMIEERKIPTPEKIGKRLVWSQKSVHAWLAARETLKAASEAQL